jgi:amino acid adenylation domain-containing protein
MDAEAALRERIAALSPKQQELLLRRLRTREPAAAGQPTATIPRRGLTRAPLSYAQQRFWFLDQVDPGTPHYNVAMAAPMNGPLDTAVLERSVNELVRRHEALRTTFELDEDDETPVQIVHERLEVPVAVTDLQHLDETERATAVQQLVRDLAAQPWDLAKGPLVRTHLVRLGPERQVLAGTMHHIISDVWSVEILLRELAVIYKAFMHSQPVPLAEPPLQYADYALWQREWLEGELLDKQAEYWRGQLGGDLAPLDLPTDRPRPAQQEYRGANHVVRLPVELSEQVKRVCVEEKTTPFNLFLTGIAALLYRYSGQTDIPIGAPVSSRARAELEGTVGYLGNTLLLRVGLQGGPTFREALRRTHDMTLDAFANQDLPFEKVVEIAQPERDLSRMPLLQVVFVYNTTVGNRDEAQQLPGFGENLAIDNGSTKFDITFGLEPSDDTFRLTLEYDVDLFDGESIERLAGHWLALLAGAVARPDLPIGALALLTAGERERMLGTWNATDAPFPGDRCLHELIGERAEQVPQAVAASAPDGSLDYAELHRRAGRLANHLRRLGAGPDVPVAVCLAKSLDVPVALLGILRAGAAYLPLDPGAPSAHRSALLADAGVRILVTQADAADGVVSSGRIETVLLDRDWPSIEAGPEVPAAKVTPGDLAYVIYTSGSTGRPKGVLLDHRGRVNNFHDFNTRFRVGPGDSVFALAALNFDMSAYDTLGTLMAGARMVLPAAGTERDPAHWLDRLRRERVTVWHSVPALLQMLVEYAEAEGSPPLPDLRLVLLGGDWIPVTLPDRIKALAPDARVIALGGATEVSMDSTIHEIEDGTPLAATVPYGRPMANQRAYVLDRDLQPLPVGVAGDLYLAGVGVGRGYLGDPALTAEKFRPGPFPEEPGRVYRTGDRAKYRADGTLELLGRSDFQIKIRGWRIEPGEIQSVLQRHPSIRDSVVVAHTGGDGTRALVAYVLAAGELDPAAAREWARERLPDYLVPSVVVPLDSFPLTANGKVDRGRLPAPQTTAETATYVPPASAVERVLAEVWHDLLGVERVGVTDNFFALGGDSIKAIQTIARAKKRGVVVTPRQLFRHQTIRELAAVAESASAGPGETGAEAPLVDSEVLARLHAAYPDLEDVYPLAPMQRQMLRNAIERPVDGLYVIHSDYLFVAGGIDVELLGQAWQIVVDRYPVLRTSFAWDGLDEPLQLVHRRAPIGIEVHDLRRLSVEEQVRRQDEVVAEDRRRGFDLTRPELVRLHLLRIEEDRYKYLSSNHHIVLDGWSRAIVQQEVFAVYEALRRGEPSNLPPVRPFRDFVAWLRRQDAAKAESVWRRHLAGFTEPTPLVAARGRPGATRNGPYAKQSVPLAPARAAALDRFTRASQVTANTVLQGAWLLLLTRYTGERDVVLGVMSSGRPTELLDVETVVGVCINALPVRTVIDPRMPLLTWLRGLQEQQAELREVEYTSLASVQRTLGLSGPPFESFMVFENYPWDGSLNRLAERLDFEHPLSQRDYTVAQFEFPLRVEVAPKIPLLIMHYYTDSFTDETVTGMIDDWAQTVERMVRDDQQPLGDLIQAQGTE